ncbi:type I methionyl aminopeptidase [Lacticaseibacillus thailandensis]|uniref:type I methionyl aminopeptidase n=1 Tax=Lacticaseibacillus thailandensis TaxID=381741 RepID=UPI0006D21D0A|nr:type I methionyl aminopeptidase [Lacticaseibacillus thailandensis]
MITIKTDREIDGIRRAGAVLAGVHRGLRNIIKPGISSWEIEEFTRQYISDHHAHASEMGFEGYQYATCVSVNDEVAHAEPRKDLILHDGDIVAVDMCVDKDGYISDSCWNYAVGNISPEAQKLMDVTKKALYLGIDQAVVGNRIGDIGHAIQQYTEVENGYGDVRELIGHGIQPTMHEAPNVPHYGKPGHGLRLKAGMTITIEPMITTGTWEIVAKEDPKTNWEYYVTADGSLCAQYEHTIAITNDGPKILTSQDPEYDAKYL